MRSVEFWIWGGAWFWSSWVWGSGWVLGRAAACSLVSVLRIGSRVEEGRGEGTTAEINPEAAKGFVAELACLQDGGEDFAPLEDCFEVDSGVICCC
jgi:hypothetical protein